MLDLSRINISMKNLAAIRNKSQKKNFLSHLFH